ncbi:hypothetical protein KR032_007075 [Drosophila birchii]|nr:hypothetical protein KR032_007075 [Drosophila birchii]
MVEFTNIKCKTMDSKFSEFEICHLKSVNRSYKYISVKVKLKKVPITDVKVNIALFKRLNGLKPFLYNISFDACKFMKNQKSNPIASYFYGFFKNHSNLNHTCPYDHDLVLDKISAEFVNNRVTKILPFPEGSYMIQFNWYAYDIMRAEVQYYLTLS